MEGGREAMVGAAGDLRLWELNNLVRLPRSAAPASLPRLRPPLPAAAAVCVARPRPAPRARALAPPDRGRRPWRVRAQVKGLEGRTDGAVLSRAAAALSLLQNLESAAGSGASPAAEPARGASPPMGGAVPTRPGESADGAEEHDAMVLSRDAEDSIRLVQSAEGRNAKLRELLGARGRKKASETDDELVSQFSEKNNAMRQYLMQCKTNRPSAAPNTQMLSEAQALLTDGGTLSAEDRVALPARQKRIAQRAAAPRATRATVVVPIAPTSTGCDALPFVTSSSEVITGSGEVQQDAEPHRTAEAEAADAGTSIFKVDDEFSTAAEGSDSIRSGGSSPVEDLVSVQPFKRAQRATRAAAPGPIQSDAAQDDFPVVTALGEVFDNTSHLNATPPNVPVQRLSASPPQYGASAVSPHVVKVGQTAVRNSPMTPAPSPAINPAPMLLSRASNHSHGQSDSRRETPKLMASHSPSQRPHLFRSIAAPGQTSETPIRVGSRLYALSETQHWRSARVVDMNLELGKMLVHFIGFDPRWDEWIPLQSKRWKLPEQEKSVKALAHSVLPAIAQNQMSHERASPAPALLHARRESKSSSSPLISSTSMNLEDSNRTAMKLEDSNRTADLDESSEELAPGWEKKYDTKMNQFFYVNHELRAMSWVRPTMELAGPNSPLASAQDASEAKAIEPVSKFSDYEVVVNDVHAESEPWSPLSREVLVAKRAAWPAEDESADGDAASVSLAGFSFASESDVRDDGDLDKDGEGPKLEKELELELRKRLEEAMGDDARFKQQQKDFVDNLMYLDLEQALDEGDAFVC